MPQTKENKKQSLTRKLVVLAAYVCNLSFKGSTLLTLWAFLYSNEEVAGLKMFVHRLVYSARSMCVIRMSQLLLS